MWECCEALGLEPVTDFMFYKGDLCFIIKGTEVLMRSGDDPHRLRGLNLSWFALDEAREFPSREVFDILIGRLRISETDEWAICSTTKGRNWFFDIIREEGLDLAFESGYMRGPMLTVIIQASWENTFLPAAYIAELRARYSSAMARQELEGKIVDFSAGTFMESWFCHRDPLFAPEIGVRAWDLASSIKTQGDYTAGVLMAKRSGYTYIVDVQRQQTAYPKELIVQTALRDGTGVKIAVEQVGMQTIVINDLMQDPRLANFKIIAYKPRGDKLQRAQPLSGRIEQGTLRLCVGPWNTQLVEEFAAFDGFGKVHDDVVDASSMAYDVLNRQPVFLDISKTPAPTDRSGMIRICSVEIHEYKAYIVRAGWHPLREMLEVADCEIIDGVEAIAKHIKPCQRRLASEELDSDNYKTVAAALGKAGASVSTSQVDVVGATYWLNDMIKKDRVYVPSSSRLYADMLAKDSDSAMSPYILNLLRIVAEVRSMKITEKPEPKPFELQRKLARKAPVKQSQGWVN